MFGLPTCTASQIEDCNYKLETGKALSEAFFKTQSAKELMTLYYNSKSVSLDELINYCKEQLLQKSKLNGMVAMKRYILDILSKTYLVIGTNKQTTEAAKNWQELKKESKQFIIEIVIDTDLKSALKLLKNKIKQRLASVDKRFLSKNYVKYYFLCNRSNGNSSRTCKLSYSVKDMIANAWIVMNKKSQREWMTGSSSWPWHLVNARHIVDNCKCLLPRQLKDMTGLIITDQAPCTQAIPWCFVSVFSPCSDKNQLSGYYFPKGKELYWSQEACKSFIGPNYYF